MLYYIKLIKLFLKQKIRNYTQFDIKKFDKIKFFAKIKKNYEIFDKIIKFCISFSIEQTCENNIRKYFVLLSTI